MSVAKPGVLFVAGQLGLGGQERQLYYLLDGLQSKNLTLAVAVWNYSQADHWVRRIGALGVQLYPIAGKTVREKLIDLRRLVLKCKPLAVQSYSFYTNFGVWLGCMGTGAVAIGAVRSTLRLSLRSAGWIRTLLCCGLPRFQVYNSYSAASEGQRLLWPLRPKRIDVVPNCTDLDEFKPTPFPPYSVIRIVGIGRLAEEKRWDVFLEALAILRDINIRFSAKIYGDGPLRMTVLEWIRGQDLQDSVSLKGFGETASVLRGSHVLLHSADSEGMPNVILEALASGRPVVTTRAGDAARYVRDGESGFIVAPGDAEAMAHRLADLARSHDKLQAMGRGARLVAERECSIDVFVERTLDLYRSIGVEVS